MCLSGNNIASAMNMCRIKISHATKVRITALLIPNRTYSVIWPYTCFLIWHLHGHVVIETSKNGKNKYVLLTNCNRKGQINSKVITISPTCRMPHRRVIQNPGRPLCAQCISVLDSRKDFYQWPLNTWRMIYVTHPPNTETWLY